MATTVSHETALKEMPKVARLSEVAEQIRDAALSQAKQKLGQQEQGWDLQKLFRSHHYPVYYEYFKHALSSAVAETLAANDKRVQAVFSVDINSNPDCESGEALPFDANLHLLVLVSKPSAGLVAYITSLDHALAASLRSLPLKSFEGIETTLDVKLITQDDLRTGKGYAPMLQAMFAPPLKVWERTA
jgi:hypothetical protein